jgi:hypothetical protein
MKKALLLACTFISIVAVSHSQITKGSILLGGNIGLNKSKIQSETNQSSKSNTVNFNPTAGIAIKDNWVVGINAGFSDFEADPSAYYSYMRDQEVYSGGIFVRRYSTLGKNFYLYGNGSINYNKTSHSQIYTNNHENYYYSKGVALSIAPGIAYAISRRFHLEASLNDLLTVGYTTSRTKNITHVGGITTSNITKDKSFGFGTNFNTSSPLYIGFRIVLGK